MTFLKWYMLGLITFPIIFLIWFNLDRIFKWNRRRWWYKTYCYHKYRNSSLETIRRMYGGGYITQKHFKKLCYKKGITTLEIWDMIEEHAKLKKSFENVMKKYNW